MKKEAWSPDRGEIIWIDYNPQSGKEMRNMHPMLVLSPQIFNKQTGIVIGLPMTTADYNSSNPFAVKFHGQRGAISYILTHQPKSFDWRERKAKVHPWKRAPDDVFATACELLNRIISI
jgi:mRNA interferase MazF